MRRFIFALGCVLGLAIPAGSAGAAEAAAAQPPKVTPAPPRQEGDGPYSQLILRGVTVINGTGAPAFGPADIVIEGNRIVQIVSVGKPRGVVDVPNRPKLAAGGREIDLTGHYALPGLIDMHGHIGGEEQKVPATYVYKLWMGHGITTIRDPGCGNGVEWCVSEEQAQRAQRDHRATHLPVRVLHAGPADHEA